MFFHDLQKQFNNVNFNAWCCLPCGLDLFGSLQTRVFLFSLRKNIFFSYHITYEIKELQVGCAVKSCAISLVCIKFIIIQTTMFLILSDIPNSTLKILTRIRSIVQWIECGPQTNKILANYLFLACFLSMCYQS